MGHHHAKVLTMRLKHYLLQAWAMTWVKDRAKEAAALGRSNTKSSEESFIVGRNNHNEDQYLTNLSEFKSRS